MSVGWVVVRKRHLKYTEIIIYSFHQSVKGVEAVLLPTQSTRLHRRVRNRRHQIIFTERLDVHYRLAEEVGDTYFE